MPVYKCLVASCYFCHLNVIIISNITSLFAGNILANKLAKARQQMLLKNTVHGNL